jgi:hypothetical protein
MGFPEIAYLTVFDALQGDLGLLGGSTDNSSLIVAPVDDVSGRQRWKIVRVPGASGNRHNIILQYGGTNTGRYLSWQGLNPYQHTVWWSTADDGSGQQQWELVPVRSAPSDDGSLHRTWQPTDETMAAGRYIIKIPGLPYPTMGYLKFFPPDAVGIADGNSPLTFEAGSLPGGKYYDTGWRERWDVIDAGTAWPAKSDSGPSLAGSKIPAAARKPIPPMQSPSDFQSQLRQGGSLILRGQDLVLGGPGNDGVVTMVLDVLWLRNARLILNGCSLLMYVNRLASFNGSVVSFLEPAAGYTPLAASNQSGAVGPAGASSGSVTIFVMQEMYGTLNVDLTGQQGGIGGRGGVGLTGSQGSPGLNQILVTWQGGPPREATDGGKGGTGQPGARGGPGGKGGEGGAFLLINHTGTAIQQRPAVSAPPIGNTTNWPPGSGNGEIHDGTGLRLLADWEDGPVGPGFSFSAGRSQGGPGGSGGSGGPGGPGGPGGAAATAGAYAPPKAGNPGPPGDAGVTGDTGLEGSPGGAGNATVIGNRKTEV